MHIQDIVVSLRKTLSVAVVAVALVLSGSGPVIAGVVHQTCAAKHHDCATEFRLTRCCCGEHGDVTNDTSVSPSRSRMVGDECTAAPCLFSTVETPAVDVGFERLDHSPPSAHPLDLPILFADLRL